MSDIINFNGTIEGLGGPLIGATPFMRVIFIYYRKGTVYSVPDGTDEKGVQKYKQVVIDKVEKIKEDTPISKIEVRYIRTYDIGKTNKKQTKFDDIQVGKQGELTTKVENNWWRGTYWIPLGIGNNLVSYTENYLNGLLGVSWNMVPFSIKPIVVKGETKNVSCYVEQAKRTLDDNNNSMIKEVEYYSVSKKQDTLTITLFSVKSNLILEILLGYLENWMNSQKEAQSLNGMVVNGTTNTFPNYQDFPNEKNAWDKSNSKYFIRRKYLPGSSPSYLFSYINDSIFFFKGKLSGYSVEPNSSGDGVTVVINFEKLVAEEEAWIYEKEKGNRTTTKVEVEDETRKGDTTLIKNNSTTNVNNGGMCYINSSTTNGISNPLSQSIPLTGKGSTPPMTVWK